MMPAHLRLDPLTCSAGRWTRSVQALTASDSWIAVSSINVALLRAESSSQRRDLRIVAVLLGSDPSVHRTRGRRPLPIVRARETSVVWAVSGLAAGVPREPAKSDHEAGDAPQNDHGEVAPGKPEGSGVGSCRCGEADREVP